MLMFFLWFLVLSLFVQSCDKLFFLCFFSGILAFCGPLIILTRCTRFPGCYNWENNKTGQIVCLEGTATSCISKENTPVFQSSRQTWSDVCRLVAILSKHSDTVVNWHHLQLMVRFNQNKLTGRINNRCQLIVKYANSNCFVFRLSEFKSVAACCVRSFYMNYYKFVLYLLS